MTVGCEVVTPGTSNDDDSSMTGAVVLADGLSSVTLTCPWEESFFLVVDMSAENLKSGSNLDACVCCSLWEFSMRVGILESYDCVSTKPSGRSWLGLALRVWLRRGLV